MIQKKRLALILSKLELEKALSLKEIIALTGVSRDTARRDIVKLFENDLVKRTYGGITLPNSFRKIDNYLERSSELNKEKQQLAAAAGKLIQDVGSIYLDVSTTVSFIPHYLKTMQAGSELFAATNSIDIADQLLRDTECTVRILGGNIDREKRCVIGTRPLSELDDYKFGMAFLSAVGIDSDGVYYAFEEDIDMKKKIRLQTEILVLLIDASKINQTHKFRGYELSDIDILVTNKQLPDGLVSLLNQSRVTVVYTEEGEHD
ncbi:DeoR/GlpR family DNA-binding transcription regulator [Sporolactobacillus sp. CQH2019]|uniref:DeoR/GlpR family DNA-binding transcription regulator n=1 Tax=Sporolactobacillus sp. CQH2019 TaxID=3023512 RepID=UPI002368A1D8|nr:DeoR/GlpR family DNA-binding transcription regulator [Sporolactobacillus sp. CQH2019]MDD9150169.1 DeoR/GlpR family DNA-binding transcription regulator [Sporolactobacillus sp. CQH2019]